MDAADWDARYAASDRVWSKEPNRWVAEVAPGLTRGRALDMGAGEGRNALWLAEQGWEVDATDFSPVAITRLRAWSQERTAPGEGRTAPGEGRTAPGEGRTAPGEGRTAPGEGRTAPGEGRLRAWVADATETPGPAERAAYDLVVQCYLHLPPESWAGAVGGAVERTRPGGSVLLIGHAGVNLTQGVGGPQQRDLLFDPDEVEAVAEALPVRVDRCEIRARDVPGAQRPGLDTVVVLTRL